MFFSSSFERKVIASINSLLLTPFRILLILGNTIEVAGIRTLFDTGFDRSVTQWKLVSRHQHYWNEVE
jgi:hypothetical protein